MEKAHKQIDKEHQPLRYTCPNKCFKHTSELFNTDRSVCTACEDMSIRGLCTARFGLLRYCSVCHEYIQAKNFTRSDHRCLTSTENISQDKSLSLNNTYSDSNGLKKKFGYMKEFLQFIRLEVQELGVTIWGSFRAKYEELITKPTWNTSNLRAKIEKHNLLGDSFAFVEHEQQYYLVLSNDLRKMASGWHVIFTKSSTVQNEHSNTEMMSATSITQNHIDSYHKSCPGFKPNNSALDFCSILNTLVLVTGVIAIRDEKNPEIYRSIYCKSELTGREHHCSMCSVALKVVNQRGRRAKNAVISGTIQRRNMFSTNTVSLLQAKVMHLQKSHRQANETIRQQQQQIDGMFEDNVDTRGIEKDELLLKKTIFLKFCTALGRCEGYPFFFELMESQLDNFVKTTPYLHRYSDQIKHFWKHFRHNAGPKSIDILRGVLSDDDNYSYNMILPCNATLDKIEDVGSYGTPDSERVKEILTALEDHVNETGCKEFIVSFDGIIVIPRYQYNEALDFVLGGEVPLTPEKYLEMTKDKLDNALGNEVLQFVLQSLDGVVTIRVGHWVKPDKANAMNFVISRLISIVDIFYKKGVCELIGSCSDGDLATVGVQHNLEKHCKGKYGTPWFHLYDFSHALKATRNALMNRNLQPGKYIFHMKDLIQLCMKSPSGTDQDVLGFIQDSWLNPPDVMRIKPCLEITSKQVQMALNNLPDMYTNEEKSLAKEISEYLRQIRKIYDCFMDVTISDEEALRQLYGKACTGDGNLAPDNLLSYLCGWNESPKHKLANQTSRHISVTILNLYKLIQYLECNNVQYKPRRSVLSTLCVELGFSITRSIQTFVTASEYSTLSGRTEWQQRILCTDSSSRGFTVPSDIKQPSKYYNACIVHYSKLPDLHHKESGINKKKVHSDEVMREMREKLASQGESTGHKKIRSHSNTSHKKVWFHCDELSCKHLPFHYPAALESHFVVVHGITATEASNKLKAMKYKMMNEIIAERTCERKISASESANTHDDVISSDISDPDQQEIDLEAFFHTCNDDSDTVQHFCHAKGDDIFPITDELIHYTEDLEDTFRFMQEELLNESADCSQTEYNLNEKKPIIVSFCDCETINLYKYPKGCPCEIAVAVQGMDDILCSRINPYPHLTQEHWCPKSIAIHGISPDDVIGQPLLENVLQSFYRLVTVEKRCRAIVVAFNAPFDNSRITSCSQELVADFDEYDVTWVDARKLIGEELISDEEGRVIHRTGKLSEIFEYRLKDVDVIDFSKIHGARYDTYMLQKLLLHKHESLDAVRQVIIQASISRKGDSCSCQTGCTTCACAVDGATGCSENCKCFGCVNPIKSRSPDELPFQFESLNDSLIMKLTKHELKIFLFNKEKDLRGNKVELQARLTSCITSGASNNVEVAVSMINAKRGSKKKMDVSMEKELTRDDVLSMSKQEAIKHLKQRYNVDKSMTTHIGDLHFQLLNLSNLSQSDDEILTIPKKYKKRREYIDHSANQQKSCSKKRVHSPCIDENTQPNDVQPDSTQLPPTKRRSH